MLCSPCPGPRRGSARGARGGSHYLSASAPGLCLAGSSEAGPGATTGGVATQPPPSSSTWRTPASLPDVGMKPCPSRRRPLLSLLGTFSKGTPHFQLGKMTLVSSNSAEEQRMDRPLGPCPLLQPQALCPGDPTVNPGG